VTLIGPVDGRPVIRGPTAAPRRAAGGFQVPEAVADSGAPPAPVLAGGGIATVSLEVLLAADALDATARRDEAARRHGQALLRDLGVLQQRVLAGGDLTETLARLAQLVGDVPDAADPRLAETLAQIALRARIELTRRGG